MKRFVEPPPALDACAAEIVAACREVHEALGPGFLESVYDHALSVELELRGVSYRRQVPVPVLYKGHRIGEHRVDFWVAEMMLVEIKAVENLSMIHRIQVRSYLKATATTLGLLVNFNVGHLLHGVKRVVLSDAG